MWLKNTLTEIDKSRNKPTGRFLEALDTIMYAVLWWQTNLETVKSSKCQISTMIDL